MSLNFIIYFLLFSVVGFAGPSPAYHTIQSSQSLVCRSFYNNNIAILKDQTELIHQIERANLKQLMDPRHVYYYYEKYLNSLPDVLKAAVIDYKGVGYGHVNLLLRKSQLDLPPDMIAEVKQKIVYLDRAIDFAPSVPNGLVLFRGIPSLKSDFGRAKAGDVIADKGFVSTSLSVLTGLGFAQKYLSDASATSILQILYIRNNHTRGLYIEADTATAGFAAESEIVLDKNTQFRILKTQTIDMEVTLGFTGAPPFEYPNPANNPIKLVQLEKQLELFEKPKDAEQLDLFPDTLIHSLDPLDPSYISLGGHLPIGNPGFPPPMLPSPNVFQQESSIRKIIVQHIEVIQENGN